VTSEDDFHQFFNRSDACNVTQPTMSEQYGNIGLSVSMHL